MTKENFIGAPAEILKNLTGIEKVFFQMFILTF
jgi:cell division protein FtsL